MMVSVKQKKVWRYVEEGKLLKLKSYLRKHSNVEVNFTRGKRRRGVLHLACSQADDGLLRVLLKHRADPLLKDRNGDTPLHLAARKAQKYGWKDYNDLVVPLSNHCPAALRIPNNAGVTPDQLLQGLSFKKERCPRSFAPQCPDPEQEWREKLQDECQDEFFTTFGQYDEDFTRDDEDEEEYGDWVERIRREYEAKKQARARMFRKQSQKKEEETKREEERQRRKMEEEHREYLERASRKKEEIQQAKKSRYKTNCDTVFLSSSSSSCGILGYNDIPWPAPGGSVDEMIAVILHGVDRSDTAVFRKFLRRQQALWHPDKFAQRCGGRLQETERERIMGTVTALSQQLNKLAQSLR